jgi:D-3-phosphoglycerate dehydrogenase / 2-oxoglutarate reductase
VRLVLSTHPLHPRATALIEKAAMLDIAPDLEPMALIEAAREAEVIIVRAPLPMDLFAHTPLLRAVIRHGAGVDMIPIEKATAAGVLVANVPGANARSVAEYVIFSVLALARRFRRVDHDLHSHGWSAAREHANSAIEIRGKILGIIGMGNVGREIAGLADAMGMTVVAFRPSRTTMPPNATWKPLVEVIGAADFLVLCCALTDSTRGMMNGERLALMKRSAYLINVARGAVVVQEDLVQALELGQIAGAALDVFEQQPLLAGDRLLGRVDVLVTPHLAGLTTESMQAMGETAALETLRVLDGMLPVNLINPDAVSAYRARFGKFPLDR